MRVSLPVGPRGVLSATDISDDHCGPSVSGRRCSRRPQYRHRRCIKEALGGVRRGVAAPPLPCRAPTPTLAILDWTYLYTRFKNSAGSGSDRPSRVGFGPADLIRGNPAGPCKRIGPARLGSAGSPSPTRSAADRLGSGRSSSNGWGPLQPPLARPDSVGLSPDRPNRDRPGLAVWGRPIRDRSLGS
ncbi:hypothetical protein Taro_026909 [Colocasia esculenta]|uniref:Uncharacterized protein n=1 Tax=Colocasia esculenta TaxID=4460 RepID=A0A843V7C3_COLES|nr:hypothetical protein [Colocasia esculenta]